MTIVDTTPPCPGKTKTTTTREGVSSQPRQQIAIKIDMMLLLAGVLPVLLATRYQDSRWHEAAPILRLVSQI
jgi:hypothetical protein